VTPRIVSAVRKRKSHGPSTRSLDRMRTHTGFEGPVAPAHEFLDVALVQRDFRGAWSRLDDNLRLCIAQSYLWANRKSEDPDIRNAAQARDAVAVALAEEEPADNPLWTAFARAEQQRLLEILVTPSRDPGAAGFESHRRAIADDLELVDFVDHQHGEHTVYRPTARILYRLLMRRTVRGWRVAALMTDKPPVPGWPPEFPAAGPPSQSPIRD
jgi:hypothetical protein